MTFISKGTLSTTHRMNPPDSSGAQGTGANGGWEYCEMRTYLSGTILPLVPSYVSSAIVPITKYSSDYSRGVIIDGCVTQDSLWIPSNHEVGLGTSYETQGLVYSGLFSNNASRVKYNQSDTASAWWLRSASTAVFRWVVNSGSGSEYGSSGDVKGVVLGFCL